MIVNRDISIFQKKRGPSDGGKGKEKNRKTLKEN